VLKKLIIHSTKVEIIIGFLIIAYMIIQTWDDEKATNDFNFDLNWKSQNENIQK